MSWLKLEILLFMAGYAILIGGFLLGRIAARKKEKTASIHQDSNEVTVVIPFRNEFENLDVLLNCLAKLTKGPKEFIFVNDHSTDNFKAIFKDLKISYRLLQLGEESAGKKAAISLGVANSTTQFIVTWDADIIVKPRYFEELVKWNWTDLVLLPVEMRGSEWVSGFYAMDYQLQTQANVALSGIFRPITASGANLFFSKKIFKELTSYRNDENIPSGDDQFLLRAMRKNNKKITLLTNSDLKVETQAPLTINTGMQQRIRWLGKSMKVGDGFASFFGLWVLTIQLVYYGFAWYQAYIGDWGATIVMVLIKGELDAFLATYAFQEQFNTLKVFIYQVFYPFYMIALLVTPFWKGMQWKGRKV